MIQLPFSCYCSDLKVHPKNWESAKPSLKKDWYVYYRFYDPTFKTNPKFQKGKLVIIKGMNHLDSILDRQENTQLIIASEINRLKNEAYNPIRGKEIIVNTDIKELEPSTGFNEALTQIEKRISASVSTKRDLKSVLKFVTAAAIQLRFSDLPIQTISRKHLKQILAHIDISYGESPHRYNKIRSYLMILYKELIELEVVEVNPLRDLSKKKTIQRIKQLPSETSRKAIDEHLKLHHYRFWLFTHIFFHSGARLTEMMQIRKQDVNLEKQTFIVTIKKGNLHKEVFKPIKDVAIEYWKEAVLRANENDFIFSRGLKPGSVSIQPFQVTKRWNKHVKQKLGVKEDFYSLKHLNLDETAAILDINAAAAMASHTSTLITKKHYAVNESQRQNERLKLVNNKFA